MACVGNPASPLEMSPYSLFLVSCIPVPAALSYFYFKTLISAWAAKGVLNAVRFFVAGYKIHFHFLCPNSRTNSGWLRVGAKG